MTSYHGHPSKQSDYIQWSFRSFFNKLMHSLASPVIIGPVSMLGFLKRGGTDHSSFTWSGG